MIREILGLLNTAPKNKIKLNTTPKDKIKFTNMPIIKEYNIFNSLFIDYSNNKINKQIITNINSNIEWFNQNEEIFHEFLYNRDEIIDIKFDKNNINFTFLFYFDLLISHNKDLVHYSYSSNDIININAMHDYMNDEIPKIFLAKIIYDLIYNYTGYEDITYELLQIKNNNKKIIKDNIEYLKSINLNWDEDYILKEGIDQLYTEIFIWLLKENKIIEYEYTKNFLDILEFDSINISQKVINVLSDNSNEEFIRKYLINKNDNMLNEGQINFYYFLIKYIIKDSYNLYCDFLLTTRKLFLKKIFLESFNLESINKDKGITNRFEYVIDHILDSEYYKLKMQNLPKKIKKNKKESGKSTVGDVKNKKSTGDNNIKGQIIQLKSNNISKKKEIITYERNITKGDILEDLGDSFLMVSNDNSVYIDNLNNNTSGDLELKNIIYIYKLNINGENKNKKIILLSDDKLYLFIMNENGYCQKCEEYKIQLINCSFFTEIDNNNFLVSNYNGCFILTVNLKENKTDLEKLFDTCYKGGIRINDEIIALTSNSIYNKGKEQLIFLNIKSIKSIEIVKEIIGYSFIPNINGLEIFPSENPKFLLCACLSKSNKKKNGFLIVNLDILSNNSNVKNKDENYLKFIKTETFCVNCLCHIKGQNNKDDENNDLNNSNSFFNNNNNMEIKGYILAGGVDGNKQSGIIKLYKIFYNDILECKYLQDIIHPPSFEGYKGVVNNIIQLKESGKIIIGTSEENFLFKQPNLEYYNKDSITTSFTKSQK